MRSAAAALAALPGCAAHFAINLPPSWIDPDGSYGQADGWRGAGCTNSTVPGAEEQVQGCISQWYTNDTHIPGNATIADDSPLVPGGLQMHMISYQKICSEKFPAHPIAVPGAPGYGKLVCYSMATNPWRAPGTAPVRSPCGIDGGNPDGCPAGNPKQDGCVPGGYGHGPDGRTFPGNTHPAQWTAGGEADVAFGITANHGGGYQYRLCPLPAAGRGALTEECFQKTPLDFVGDTQWLQWDADVTNRTAIPAVRTSTGTFPKGSTWTRQPIPACGTYEGGGVFENGINGALATCVGAQFEPPVPGAVGFYGQTPNDIATNPKAHRGDVKHWNVVDKVRVPAGLPPGDYVLGFRIDCEQTPQVWQQCADVRISAP